jgi:hypothetical protein
MNGVVLNLPIPDCRQTTSDAFGSKRKATQTQDASPERNAFRGNPIIGWILPLHSTVFLLQILDCTKFDVRILICVLYYTVGVSLIRFKWLLFRMNQKSV